MRFALGHEIFNFSRFIADLSISLLGSRLVGSCLLGFAPCLGSKRVLSLGSSSSVPMRAVLSSLVLRG
jgi:hypothetical protein